MRATLIVLATSLLLALAGCGGDDDEGSGGGGESSAPKDRLTVSMKDIKFDPVEIKVKVGETVKWVNDDDIEHNAVAEKGADFKSELFGKDGTFEYKAEKAGTIEYVCTIHSGMEGTIVVE